MNQPTDDAKRRLLQAMDCCRSEQELIADDLLAGCSGDPADESDVGAQDVSELDLASLRRSLAFDDQIRGAFHRVEVPADLESNLLATVSAQSSEDVPVAAPGSDVASSVGKSRAAWLKAAVTIAATAAVLMLVVSYGFSAPEKLTAQQVQTASWNWFEKLGDEGSWTSLTSRDAVIGQTGRWLTNIKFFSRQGFSTEYDPNATAFYGQQNNGGGRVFVFVFKGQVSPTYPMVPPVKPADVTGRWRISTWSGSGNVFVLAVEGTKRDYSRVLKKDMLAFAGF